MRVLVVTNMYPTEAAPASGTFVAAQVESLRNLGVETEVLHIDRDQLGRRAYARLRSQLRQAVAAGGYDVVHVMYGGVMADIVTKSVTAWPVVVSFCGTDLHGGRGNGPVENLSLRYGVVASQRAARRAAGIIVKSPNLLAKVALPGDASNVWVIPNGIDLSRFRPRDRTEARRALGWDEGRAHILFPAAPSRPEKRFALALESVERLKRSGVAAELHALENVCPDDVPVWINAADVVVLTSLKEGSPNVVKEALACNVPVVSVDVGDVRERLEGVDGCFVASSAAEDIAAKLRASIEYEGPVNGRDRVACLSLEKTAEKVRDVYRVVTAEAGEHRREAAVLSRER